MAIQWVIIFCFLCLISKEIARKQRFTVQLFCLASSMIEGFLALYLGAFNQGTCHAMEKFRNMLVLQTFDYLLAVCSHRIIFGEKSQIGNVTGHKYFIAMPL